MKKLMLIAALMAVTMSLQAQRLFLKPMVGGEFATLTKANDTNLRLGFVGGAELGFHIIDPIAITAGALYSMQGTYVEEIDNHKDCKTMLNYLNVPILANFYILPELCVKAGIQPGFLLSAKVEDKQRRSDGWLEYKNKGTDGFNTFDLSIPVGLSWEVTDVAVLEFRYNLGVSKIFKSDYHSGKDNVHEAYHPDAKNSVMMLTIGYKIPLF